MSARQHLPQTRLQEGVGGGSICNWIWLGPCDGACFRTWGWWGGDTGGPTRAVFTRAASRNKMADLCRRTGAHSSKECFLIGHQVPRARPPPAPEPRWDTGKGTDAAVPLSIYSQYPNASSQWGSGPVSEALTCFARRGYGATQKGTDFAEGHGHGFRTADVTAGKQSRRGGERGRKQRKKRSGKKSKEGIMESATKTF